MKKIKNGQTINTYLDLNRILPFYVNAKPLEILGISPFDLENMLARP